MVDAEMLGRIPLDQLMPTAGDGFAARCDRCDWDGVVRASSLAALADFDRHARGRSHRETYEDLPDSLDDGWEGRGS